MGLPGVIFGGGGQVYRVEGLAGAGRVISGW